MNRAELPVERFESTPIEGTDLVDLVITYRGPDTGARLREHLPRMRREEHGPDADGMYRYTFTPERPPTGLEPFLFPEEDPR